MNMKGFERSENMTKKSKEGYHAHKDNLFLHINHEQYQNLYIGNISKVNNSHAIIELKNEGKHLLRLDTIIKLTTMSSENQKKLVISKIELPVSYFIIKKEFISKLFVFSAIDIIINNKKHALIGIDGNSTSGKTTFGELLSKVYDCNVFHIDNYFQKPMIDTNDYLSNYASNINFKRLSDEIFLPIQNQMDSKIHTMDLNTHTLYELKHVTYTDISVIEGAYSLHPYILNTYDLKIFMKTTYFKQILRVYKRNGLKKLIQFIKRWIPMENKYFHDLQIENHADIILKR